MEYTRTFPVFCGSKTLSKKPAAVPKIPTIIKKPKFIILTAVPDTIFLFVKCRTGTRSDVRLALAAKMQKITAIASVRIFKIRNKHISSSDTNVMTDAFFKNITLWLWHILQKEAFTMLKTAAITAMPESTIAALEDDIRQKSSRNFLPKIAWIAYDIPKLQQAKLKRFLLCFLCRTSLNGRVLSFTFLLISGNFILVQSRAKIITAAITTPARIRRISLQFIYCIA